MIKATKIIKNPRITEKASDSVSMNAYVFDVAENTNKTEIRKAIFDIYKVKPLKVNIVKIQSKQIFSKGKKGVKSGGKKAVVYLKKDDKIEFV